jgi:hypothetical protein
MSVIIYLVVAIFCLMFLALSLSALESHNPK